jgi:hypothetical protein
MKLVPSDSEAGALFGRSVSLNAAGNVALVGAWYDDANGAYSSDSGAAYVFTYSVVDVSWNQTEKLVASVSQEFGLLWMVRLAERGWGRRPGWSVRIQRK